MSSAEESNVPEVTPDNPPSELEGAASANPPLVVVDESPVENPPSEAQGSSDNPSINQAEAAKPKNENDTDSASDTTTVSDIEVIDKGPAIGTQSAPGRLETCPFVPSHYTIGADGVPYPVMSLKDRMRLEELNNPPSPEEKPRQDTSDSSYEHSPPDDPNTKCQFLDDEPL